MVSMAEAPSWLISRCGHSDSVRADSAALTSRIDLKIAKAAKERARKYLPEAPQGEAGSRNDTAYKVACKLKDFGVDPLTCEELMAEQWACEPPLDPSELSHVVNSAYQYGREALGSAAPELEFDEIKDAAPGGNSLPEVKKPLKVPLPAFKFCDIKPDFQSIALIQGYLSESALSLLFGESNNGKTFLALHASFCVALGWEFFGLRVQQGAVVYFALEGGGGVKKRIAAFRKAHQLEKEDIPFWLVPCPIDLLNPKADTQRLIELIQQHSATFVVIDTLARAIAGGNENAPEDMGAFIRNVDTIREKTKAHVMIIHHSGKDVDRGARGHSSLRAAVDTEIRVSKFVAKVTKQRDFELGQEIAFMLETVDLGVDAYGEQVKSAVVRPRNISAERDFTPKPIRSGSKASQALEILRKLVAEKGQSAPPHLNFPAEAKVVFREEWRERFENSFYAGKARQTRQSAFKRASAELSASLHVMERENYVYICG
jgi:hypothetical protein